LISVIGLVLAIAAAILASIALLRISQGYPDSKARSDIRILEEEQSKMWEAINAEIRRQAVRSSRANTRGLASPGAAETSSLSNVLSLNDRDALLRQFETNHGKGI
jgi:hypothetical protein